jgi:hypothetical protein
MGGKNVALLLSAAAWLVGLYGINEQRLAAATTQKTAVVSEEPSFSTTSPDAAADAPQLVKDALAAGLEGKTDQCEELLARAIAADPDYAPARWRRGEVRFEGQWRTFDAVHERVAANPHRDAYQQRRANGADTPIDHAALARWCQENGLENEERFHWLKVLLADPSDSTARSRLRVRPYGDGLYSDQEIAAYERQQETAKKNLKQYRPGFLAICRRAVGADPAERAAALAEIAQVNDAAQLPALESAIRRETRKTPQEKKVAAYVALMQALANVPSYEATSALLNYALFAPTPEMRYEAARALKSRPVTDYVPQLMASLTAPIEGEITAHTAPDGTVSYGETLFQAGPLADQSVVRGTDYVITAGRPLRPDARLPSPLTRNQARARMQVALASRRVDAANIQAAAGNARVRDVLRNSLNIDLGEDPKAYWQAWTDYNELVFEDHPVYEYNDVRTLFTEPLTTSCFMTGTPVWTQEGLRPIETIVVGDLVLAQHPVTGEVAYRAVLEKTLGPPTPTIAISLPEEKIVATRGHRFWVERQGWEMAKSLKPEMGLHSITSVLPITSVEPDEELECHNMVVEGFHTYFVGKSQVLVHDKICPRPTISKTPGQEDALSAAKRQSNLQASAR